MWFGIRSTILSTVGSQYVRNNYISCPSVAFCCFPKSLACVLKSDVIWSTFFYVTLCCSDTSVTTLIYIYMFVEMNLGEED